MAKVGDSRLTKETLGSLEDKFMVVELLQDNTYMAEMIRPCRAVNQNIIKENKHKPT
jgi:hypothetical protein